MKCEIEIFGEKESRNIMSEERSKLLFLKIKVKERMKLTLSKIKKK